MKYFFTALFVQGMLLYSSHFSDIEEVMATTLSVGAGTVIFIVGLVWLSDRERKNEQREYETLKRALWVFRGVVAESQTLKGGNLVVKKGNYQYLMNILIATRDIDCLPKELRKKKKPKAA
jgi:hypothetical protein